MNEKLLQMARSVVGSEHQMSYTGEIFVFREDQLARFAELALADDKRDAERYRFLRGCDIPAGAGGAHCIIKGQFGMTVGDGEDLDRAIDNAMSARGKQEKV